MAEININPVTQKSTTTDQVVFEKQPATAFSESSVGDLESDSRKPERHLAQAIWTIVCGVALPCIPIIVVSTVLLVVIFKYRVVPRDGWPEFYVEPSADDGINNVTDLIYAIRKEGGAPAYYVDYNPSTITTIAGWTSRVVPYLSSSIMALVAFYAARNIVVKSKRGKHDELPTPKQLTILIGLLSGSGWSPLKEALTHRWGTKERLVAPLPAAFTVLAMISVLGILIPIFDTWFGVAVHPVTITQLTNVTSPGKYHSFGRHLNSSSYESPMYAPNQSPNSQNWSWPINIDMPTPHTSGMFLHGSQAAATIQLNQPTKNLIANYTGPAPSQTGAGEASQQPNITIYFLGDSRSSTALDFRAHTLGMSTQCKIMTSECYTDSNATDPFAFSCPGGFQGDITFCQPNIWPIEEYGSGSCSTGIGFAKDPQLSQTAGNIMLGDFSGLGAGEIIELFSQNPIYFGTWATGYPTAGDIDNPLFAGTTADGMPDQEVFADGSTNAIWMLNCSATIYEVEYTYVNGALHTFDTKLASGDWGAFFSAPFSWFSYALGLQPVESSLRNAAYLAGNTARNGTDLANIWALAFSRAALSLSIGVFEPLVNDLEQLRDNAINVARVPLVPLYLLLSLKLLYVVVVIVLAVGVYCFTHPAETEVVKAQLSMHGLAAAHFNEPDLVRSNVVKEVQSRLGQAGSPDGGDDSRRESDSPSSDGASSTDPKQQVNRATTAPVTSREQDAAEGQEHKTKVGLIPTKEGAWTFAVLANGAWQSIKPIVKEVVLQEAQAGQLGTAGNVYAAWK